jgi:hypothetical protein
MEYAVCYKNGGEEEREGEREEGGWMDNKPVKL